MRNFIIGIFAVMLSGCGGGFKAANLSSSGSNQVTSTLCTPNAQQSCFTGNGTGSQTCNSAGSAWRTCGNLTSCDSGYNLQNGVCVANVTNACTPNAQQSCQTGNGTGSQTCNSAGSAWGTCGNLTSCDPGFNLQNGVCVANVCIANTQRFCPTGDGSGMQACNSSGSAWGICGNISSCNSGYSLFLGACFVKELACPVPNGSGMQTWLNGGYGNCQATSCNSAYTLSAGTCALQTAFYVSPNGTGTACTAQQPCALGTARALVEQTDTSMQSDFYIYLFGGTYQLTQPLTFGAADSGFNGFYVNYVAVPGTAPVISGGLVIQNWSLKDSNLGIYQASVPSGFDTRQLYVNGTRMQRARVYLQGNHGLPGGVAAIAGGYAIDDGAWTERMASYQNIQNMEVVSRNEWQLYRCPVAAITPSGGNDLIAVQNPCWNNSGAESGIGSSLNWIENAYELLSQPGQWYLNKATNVIYYIPQPGENINTDVIVAGNVPQLIQGQNANHVRFANITFAYTTWLEPNTSAGYAEAQAGMHINAAGALEKIPAAVSFSPGSNLVFSGNQFLHLGGIALNFDTGSQGIVVQGNTFADVSGGAIVFGDFSDAAQTNPALENSGVTISNNYLTQTTLEYESSVGIFLGYTTNSNIVQNEIAGTNYTGISVGWGWSTAPTYASNNHITQNWIHDVMQTLLDGGGVYTLSSQPNSGLTGNLIENIGPIATCNSSPSPNYLGYVGIYHDNGSQYYTDSQNVVRNSCGYWLLLQGGWASPLSDTYNTAENNNYVDRDYAWCNGGPGSSAACNFDGNSVTNLTIFGASPTSGAQSVINAAGISAPYLYAKTIRSGPLY